MHGFGLKQRTINHPKQTSYPLSSSSGVGHETQFQQFQPAELAKLTRQCFEITPKLKHRLRGLTFHSAMMIIDECQYALQFDSSNQSIKLIPFGSAQFEDNALDMFTEPEILQIRERETCLRLPLSVEVRRKKIFYNILVRIILVVKLKL